MSNNSKAVCTQAAGVGMMTIHCSITLLQHIIFIINIIIIITIINIIIIIINFFYLLLLLLTLLLLWLLLLCSWGRHSICMYLAHTADI